jgi:LacI family transcriptional regulator
MKDIAKELGVSTVTVSRALSGGEGVSGEMESRVRQQAEKMGYAYNALPKSMRTGRYNNIGILVGAKYLGQISYYWLFIQKLLQILKGRDLMGVVEIVSDEEELSRATPSFIRLNKVDGLILLGQLEDGYLSMIAKRTPSCVFLDFYSEIGGCDCIVSNNFLSSYNLTKLLIERGHRKIAFIGSTSATTSILDRYMGFCKAMIEENLPYGEGIPDRDSHGHGFTEFHFDAAQYTAYVCNSDQTAGKFIRQIRRAGLNVPADISLVSFDNAGAAITGDIGVTSVELNMDTMCETAINTVINHIENEEYKPKGKIFIESRIIEKESIGSPKL